MPGKRQPEPSFLGDLVVTWTLETMYWWYRSVTLRRTTHALGLGLYLHHRQPGAKYLPCFTMTMASLPDLATDLTIWNHGRPR